MFSLRTKLTLAFLAVGLIGAMLVAVMVSQRTRVDFDQFITDRLQADLISELTNYYQEHGSWEGLGTIMVRNADGRLGPREYMAMPVTLVDENGIVVQSRRRYRAGEQLSPLELRRGLQLEVDGETVGTLLLESAETRSMMPLPQSPEADFIARFYRGIILAALAATAVALLVGMLLARTIARPVRELTAATKAVAQGSLGYQVPVRTEDELGELARSFNQMSIDLAQASHLRRQMTADIAHELRTPLSVILGYTEALDDGKLVGSPEMYAAMHGEAQLLSHLIDDLRTLSLADAGQLPLNRQLCTPTECLEKAASAHATLAAQRGISLQVEKVPDLPAVEVDPERIAQVLGNLISNALRFTPEGGQIVLRAYAAGAAVALQVADSGIGMPPEDLPHIFERFYRGDKARQQHEGESGLGLAIAKSIVEAHDGSMDVTSTVGQGSTFTITLPASRS